MAAIRCFIAFEIPQEVREKIAATQLFLKKFNEPVRWVKPEGVHLTIKFLGDVEESRITEISDKLQHIADQTRAFSVKTDGLGAFPNLKRPRVLWVGLLPTLQEHGLHLAELFQRINNDLAEVGFKNEQKKFKPHLTIARVKAPLSRRFGEEFAKLSFEGDEIDFGEIVLMQSTLKPTGAVYTPLYKVILNQD
jgi:2'-5' RNA ligase